MDLLQKAMKTYGETRKRKDLEGDDSSKERKLRRTSFYMTFLREKTDWNSEKREKLEIRTPGRVCLCIVDSVVDKTIMTSIFMWPTISPFGRARLPWILLWPLNIRWFELGLEIDLTVPSIKPKQFDKGATFPWAVST